MPQVTEYTANNEEIESPLPQAEPEALIPAGQPTQEEILAMIRAEGSRPLQEQKESRESSDIPASQVKIRNENIDAEMDTEMSPEQKKFIEQEKLRLAALEKASKEEIISMYCRDDEDDSFEYEGDSRTDLIINIRSLDDLRQFFLWRPSEELKALRVLQFEGNPNPYNEPVVVPISELSDAEFEAFCQKFSSCIRLERFALQCIDISDVSGWERMGTALAKLSNLRALTVRKCLVIYDHNKIHPSQIDSLNQKSDACYDAILKLQDLEALDFSHNVIAGREGLERLLPFLPKLRSLTLERVIGFYEDDQYHFPACYNAIARCSQLESFDFSGNRVSPNWTGLRSAISQLKQLKTLKLREVLYNFPSNNREILYKYSSSNNDQILLLRRVLSDIGSKLERLDLSGNINSRRETWELRAIAEAISTLSDLRTLILRGNSPSFRAFCDLISSVSNCQQLEILDCSGYGPFSREDCKNLGALLLKLSNLRKLKLCDIGLNPHVDDHLDILKELCAAFLEAPKSLLSVDIYLGQRYSFTRGLREMEGVCLLLAQNQSNIMRDYTESVHRLIETLDIPLLLALKNLILSYCFVGAREIQGSALPHTALKNKIQDETPIAGETKCTAEKVAVIHLASNSEIPALQQQSSNEYDRIFFHTTPAPEISNAGSTSPSALTYAYSGNLASSSSSSYFIEPINRAITGSSNTSTANSSTINTVTSASATSPPVPPTSAVATSTPSSMPDEISDRAVKVCQALGRPN